MGVSSVILVCVFLLILAQTYGGFANSKQFDCSEEHDIVKMIPTDKILTEVMAASIYDPEFKAAIDHIGSPEFKEKTAALERLPQYKKLLAFCAENHIQILEALSYLQTALPDLLLYASKYPIDTIDRNEVTGGVRGLILRIYQKHLSMADIRHCFEARVSCDPEYKEKMSALQSSEFQNLLQNLRETKEYAVVAGDLLNYSIDLNLYLSAILAFFRY